MLESATTDRLVERRRLTLRPTRTLCLRRVGVGQRNSLMAMFQPLGLDALNIKNADIVNIK
jgi:hypothetical protein